MLPMAPSQSSARQPPWYCNSFPEQLTQLTVITVEETICRHRDVDAA